MQVKIIKKDTKDLLKEVQAQIKVLAEQHTKSCADEHKKQLDQAIEDTRVRPTKQVGNHLKDQIQVEKLASDTPGYGVGNIETLNQKAPWWAWINFGRAFSGRTTPPTTTGYFEPGQMNPDQSSFREGILIHTTAQNVYLINPKKAIEPHNYIEKALGIMLGKIKDLIK